MVAPPQWEQFCGEALYAPPENEEGCVGGSGVAPPQHQILYVLRSGCVGSNGMRRRRESKYVCFWEEGDVVDLVVQAADEQRVEKKR